MVAFAGTVTSRETEPAGHGTVTGSPGTAGATENLHVAAVPPTVADSEIVPPAEESAEGDAVNAETVGAADASPTRSRNSDAPPRTSRSIRATLGRKDMKPPLVNEPSSGEVG